MTEIRPVRPDEAEAFLELLCDVFSLDLNRAYDVFFSEPLFDLDRKWALFEGREMVSILTTTPLIFGWGRAAMAVASAAGRRWEGSSSPAVAVAEATMKSRRVMREVEGERKRPGHRKRSFPAAPAVANHPTRKTAFS